MPLIIPQEPVITDDGVRTPPPIPVPHMLPYCASKFALHGFSDALRAELARDKIDVLLVSPSTTQSEFFDHVLGNKEKPRGRFRAMTHTVNVTTERATSSKMPGK